MVSIGLDWSAREVRFAIAEHGSIVERGGFHGLSGLERVLGPGRPPARVAVEAGRQAWIVYDRLQAWGHQACVLDTTRIKQIGIGAHGRKNDKLDADAIALALDRGSVPTAYILSPAHRALREKLQVRAHLVTLRAQTVVVARGLVSAHGESIAACDTERFVRQLGRTPLLDTTRSLIAPLVPALEACDAPIAELDEELEALARHEPAVDKLMSVPGVGPIVALMFIAVVDEPTRFRNAHQVAAYLGLVPMEDSTGGADKHRLGHITKQGHSEMRALLVQAAWCVLRSRGDDPLGRWARKLAKRRGQRIAVVALARRLATILWALWKRAQVYEPARLAGAMAHGMAAQAQSAELTAQALRRAQHKLMRRSAERRASRRTEVHTPC